MSEYKAFREIYTANRVENKAGANASSRSHAALELELQLQLYLGGNFRGLIPIADIGGVEDIA